MVLVEEKPPRAKQYDLEDRTLQFAKSVRSLMRALPKIMGTLEDGSQVIRASGSVGANYIEANEALSKKDFIMRIKICRKEAKESRYWLQLITTGSISELEQLRQSSIKEAQELEHIFAAILRNSQ